MLLDRGATFGGGGAVLVWPFSRLAAWRAWSGAWVSGLPMVTDPVGKRLPRGRAGPARFVAVDPCHSIAGQSPLDL